MNSTTTPTPTPPAPRGGREECPFCGHKPKLHEWYFGAVVVCSDCKARGPEVESQRTRHITCRLAWKLWKIRFQPHTPNRSGGRQ